MATIVACHSTAAANQIILAKIIVFIRMDSRAAAGFREVLREAGGGKKPRLASKEGTFKQKKMQRAQGRGLPQAPCEICCVIGTRRAAFGNLNHLLLETLGFFPDELRKAVFGVVHK